MAYSPYFVGPYKVGLETDLDSYLIPDDAYPTLINSYLWRGKIYKKNGYNRLGIEKNNVYTGRLGIRIDYLPVRAGAPQVYNTATLYHPIEPGSLIITDGITTFTDNGIGGMILTAGVGTSGVINYTSGVYGVTFGALNNGAQVTAQYLVAVNANSPVMGLAQFDIISNIQVGLVAFDLTAAYYYDSVNLIFNQTKYYKGTSNTVAWTGSDTNFFDTTNYQRAMFATNDVPGANFYIVTAVTVAGNAQITTSVANNLRVGDSVYLSNVTTAAAPNLMRNRYGTVSVAGNPFTVSFSTVGSGAYMPGGVVWEINNTATGAGDGIRWFDGYTAGLNPATGWVNFQPPLDATDTPQILQGALLITPYKGYLVVLNTFEGVAGSPPTNYTNRARWSQFGNVYFSPPYPTGTPIANANADGSISSGQEWYQIPGRGGFIDAPTGQDIIGAEFIKDTLIVYFEQSVYKLTYTGNPVLPFLWEKVNAEIGATSTFGTVPFDKSVLSVGPNGIYGCDSVNIERTDRIIPDQVFEFKVDSNNAKRIQGVRDFYSESVQWLYCPDGVTSETTYPTQSLYYNYLTNSYSIFENTFTCFGHYNVTTDLTWAGAVNPWNSYGRAWNSFVSQTGFPIIIAGNQQGFVFTLQNADGTLITGNDESMVIQSITSGPPSVFTVINHNLQPFDFIYITNAQGVPGGFNDTVYQVQEDVNYTANTFTLLDVNNDAVSVAGYTFAGRISIVDNFYIQTKNLNPFFATGKSVRMGYADFYVDNVTKGEVTVYLYINDQQLSTVLINPISDNEQQTLSLEQTNQTGNSKFWQRVYFNTQAQFINLVITFSKSQIFDVDNFESQFVLHGSIYWMKPTGRLLDISS